MQIVQICSYLEYLIFALLVLEKMQLLISWFKTYHPLTTYPEPTRDIPCKDTAHPFVEKLVLPYHRRPKQTQTLVIVSSPRYLLLFAHFTECENSLVTACIGWNSRMSFLVDENILVTICIWSNSKWKSKSFLNWHEIIDTTCDYVALTLLELRLFRIKVHVLSFFCQ